NDLYGDSLARFLTTIWPSMSMKLTLDRVEMIVTRLHHINPRARIVLLGLYDPYRRPALDSLVALWDSRLIARFAYDHRVHVIRLGGPCAKRRCSLSVSCGAVFAPMFGTKTLKRRPSISHATFP